MLGPSQPLSRRLRQHADAWHLQPNTDDNRADLHGRGKYPQSTQGVESVSNILQPARVPGRKRQRLVPPAGRMMGLVAGMTVEELRAHFQTAIELEHSTIPPYLCALYSLDAQKKNDAQKNDEQKNQFAYQVIQSVVMEEMLHMIQAANILAAIGGRPALNNPKFIPEYPTFLPHSDDAFKVGLQKFSR